jgi:succinoglycan biosynthesis transport protein ExoP
MSVEFRQRSISDYIAIFRRRKWNIFLPTIAMGLAFWWVSAGLPDVYESTTLLTIKNPEISEKVAPSLTDNNVSERVQSVGQNVLSRTSLEPLVTKYDLYRDIRAAGFSMEEVLVRMRKNITVDLEKLTDDKVAGFRITYRGEDPEKARTVTAELANKYIAAQNIESTQNAETTREFVDNQLAQAKAQLDALEKQRIDIMTQNVETLPDSAQGLIAQLQGARNRDETIAKDREVLMTEKGRLQDTIRSLNSQARLVDDFSQAQSQDAVEQVTRVEDTPAYGQLIQRRAELTSRLESLKKQYRDKHPDVIQGQTDINAINEELNKLTRNADQRVRLANQSLARKAEMQKKSLDLDKEKAESQIALIERQLAMKDIESRDNAAQIADLESKLNTIPNVRVALDGIDNQYQSAKANYDEVLKKFNAAQGQLTKEVNLQGETIRLVDPANLPETPANKVKKPFFIALGAFIGLGLGVLLAIPFELRRLTTVQGIEDVKHYTHLKVLASIPPLFTEEENAKRKFMSRLKLAGGIAASMAAIPLTIILLEVTHVLERFN